MIKIGKYSIGQSEVPFIIGEMSGNHNKSLERALEIVDAGARAGLHAIKLQTFTPDTMTLNIDQGNFFVSDPKSLWKGSSLYQLYKNAFTPWEWHQPIFDRCKEHGMIGFSTPFDETAVDFLESLNVPCYKVSSMENTDLPLIRKVALTEKPLIISTGLATLSELHEAVETARVAGCNQIILLKCTSTYPAEPENSNILTIPHMRDLFKCEAGISDHTLGIGVALAGIALGATVVEKHITIRRADGGVDSEFSMEPEEIFSLVTESRRAWLSVGKVSYGPTEQEKGSLQYRRSLYVVQDMHAGEPFTRDNLKAIRPGDGLSPKYYEVLIGKKTNRNVKRGTPATWDLMG